MATMELDPTIAAKLPPHCLKLFRSKEYVKLSFAELAKRMHRSEVWVAAVFYGQAKIPFEDLKRLVAIFDAEGDVRLHDLIDERVDRYVPNRGIFTESPPRNPTLYRLHEALNIYGHPIAALINEKFGDGIMSAVDFNVTVDKDSGSGDDRVKITMNGKFLPYAPF